MKRYTDPEFHLPADPHREQERRRKDREQQNKELEFRRVGAGGRGGTNGAQAGGSGTESRLVSMLKKSVLVPVTGVAVAGVTFIGALGLDPLGTAEPENTAVPAVTELYTEAADGTGGAEAGVTFTPDATNGAEAGVTFTPDATADAEIGDIGGVTTAPDAAEPTAPPA